MPGLRPLFHKLAFHPRERWNPAFDITSIIQGQLLRDRAGVFLFLDVVHGDLISVQPAFLDGVPYRLNEEQAMCRGDYLLVLLDGLGEHLHNVDLRLGVKANLRLLDHYQATLGRPE